MKYQILIKAVNECALTIEADSHAEAKARSNQLTIRDLKLDPDAWEIEIVDVEKEK